MKADYNGNEKAQERIANMLKPKQPTKMTIQEAKDRVAKKLGYKDWVFVLHDYLNGDKKTKISTLKFNSLEDEAMQLYASQFSESSKLDELKEYLLKQKYNIALVEVNSKMWVGQTNYNIAIDICLDKITELQSK